MNPFIRSVDRDERGVVSVLVALLITVLLGFTALAVDTGYRMVTKNELQNIADAAALAATRQLGVTYESLSLADQKNYVADPATLVSIVQNIAQQNVAAGVNISILPGDVTIGHWDPASKTLTPGLDAPNAVRVISRRDTSVNGPLTTFFARVFGANTVNVSATATAALTGLSSVGPGGLPFPVGISKTWFDTGFFCDQPIRFNPTSGTTSCAGWDTMDSSTHSASQLRNILQGLTNGTYISPAATAGESYFNFTGGDLASDFSDFQTLFETMKVKNQAPLDNDNDSNTWTTTIPVYDQPCGSNPSGDLLIVGFAKVTIDNVLGPPAKEVWAKVKCDAITSGRGSGTNYGTLGSIPGLVQ